MWYVLAAANALSGDSELIAGTQLRVPEVGVSKNDASTFKPYNPNEIVGSTSPGLPYIPPPGSLSCKQTMILLATTIVRVAAGFFGGVAGVMLADALMQKVEINSGIRSQYSLGETVAAGVFAMFAPAIQSATGWAKAGYAAVAAATAYTSSYLVDKSRGADVHFNWGNLAASVVTSMISNKLGAVGNTGVAAGGTISNAMSSTAFSWSKVATDAMKNLAISVVNKGVTQLITGDKANWDAGAMFADSFGNALGSAVAVKLNQKFLSAAERKALNAMSPESQKEYEALRTHGRSSRQAFDYVTNAGGLRAMGEQLLASFEAQEEGENNYDGPQYIEDEDTLEIIASSPKVASYYGEGYDRVNANDHDGMHRDAGASSKAPADVSVNNFMGVKSDGVVCVAPEEWSTYVNDIDYVARTLYGEARGQSFESKLAVAWVIRNRLESGRWGDSYQDVVTAKYQFTSWDKKIDPGNYKAIMEPKGAAWEDSLRAAEIVVSSPSEENVVPGATHYYSPKAQKALHRSQPNLYPETPSFLRPPSKPILVPNPKGVPSNEFLFYKGIR